MGQHKCPAVARLAHNYLAIPSMSASTERMFSTARNVATPCRAALHHVGQLTFLHGKLCTVLRVSHCAEKNCHVKYINCAETV